MTNEQIIFEALNIIKKSKAIAGEVYLTESNGTKINVLNGDLENLEFSQVRGIGVRVLQNHQIGFSFTTDLSKRGLEKVVREALDNSGHTLQDLANGFPKPTEILTPVPLPLEQYYDASLERTTLKEKFAREYDSRITALYTTRYFDKVEQVFIANTQGINYHFPISRCLAYTDAIATDESGSQSGTESDFALSIAGLSPQKIGEGAAKIAIAKLGARQYSTQKTNLILTPEITAQLFKAFVPAFYADNVLKEKSLFRELNQRIASEKVTLIDDGQISKGANTVPVDDEGIRSQETILINQGYLANFLHSFYTAQKMNMEPTGNAIRSFSSPPIIGPTNLYLKPGFISQEELLGKVRDGIYIHELMGLHTIDPVSGNFSLGASGRIIENSELTYPVEGIAIAGNIIELLNFVIEVANDLRFFPDGSGGCTILLKEISVSGK